MDSWRQSRYVACVLGRAIPHSDNTTDRNIPIDAVARVADTAVPFEDMLRTKTNRAAVRNGGHLGESPLERARQSMLATAQWEDAHLMGLRFSIGCDPVEVTQPCKL